MKLIIYNDVTGEIVRIGLYSDSGKWLKWVPKKQLDKYVDECDEIENKNI